MHRKRLVGVPMGQFRPDPNLDARKGSANRGHNAKTQDRIIREIVERERIKREQA